MDMGEVLIITGARCVRERNRETALDIAVIKSVQSTYTGAAGSHSTDFFFLILCCSFLLSCPADATTSSWQHIKYDSSVCLIEEKNLNHVQKQI